MAVFAFVLIAALETWRQRLTPGQGAQRWVTNLSLFGLEQVLTLATAGMLAGVAASVAGRSSLARLIDAWPDWTAFVFAVVALDATAYVSHVLAHHVGPWWRLHAVHHSDTTLDVTTTVRHHPLETVPTALAIGLCAWLFGLTVAHVTSYGALTFVVQSIAHADLRLSRRAMRWAGVLFVTPELHELHHSRHRPDTNSNYGQLLSVWDRMFGTLRHSPSSEPIAVGLDTYASARFGGLSGALTQPFRRPDIGPAD